MLWSLADAVLDQYVVPLFFITKYFAPLSLYASPMSSPMLFKSKSWGMFVCLPEWGWNGLQDTPFFFVVMKGEFDAVLKWSFEHKISMILVGKIVSL